jgi:hypothetical protein
MLGHSGGIGFHGGGATIGKVVVVPGVSVACLSAHQGGKGYAQCGPWANASVVSGGVDVVVGSACIFFVDHEKCQWGFYGWIWQGRREYEG